MDLDKACGILVPQRKVDRIKGRTTIDLSSISSNHIDYVLSYVKKSERCILSASVNPRTIVAHVRFSTPSYTARPVEYLSSSALCVSLVVCHR